MSLTPEWKAEDVLSAVQGRCLHAQDWAAHGVAIDSRTTQKGDLFIAIQGNAMDGHAFVAKAFEAGAAAAIVHQQPANIPENAPLIHVDDTFAALHALGRASRARTAAKIIAVTGSVGKTSSKEQLRLMLGAVDDTYATEGTLNNHWGLPLSLARLPASAKYGIMEIGMNHAGELADLSREARPHIALITNVEAVHLEFFASTEAIADAKAEIFLGMEPDGTAVLNRDNPHFARLAAAAKAQGIKKILGFGRDPKSDARLLSLKMDETGSDLEAVILGEKIACRIGAAGEHLALNALGALLTCAAAGADLSICAEALAGYRAPKGRGTRHLVTLPGGGTITIMDESYNASPVATKAAIAVLGHMPVGLGGRRIVALGDMLELGETSPDLHMSLADALIEAKVDRVHCCGPLMAHLHGSLPPEMRGYWTEKSHDLAGLVAADVHGGDVVLVKGSKSVKMPAVIDALRALSAKSCCKLAG